MESTAKFKYIRISPRKMRLVVDQIRGKRVEEALTILEYSLKRGAKLIEKTLKSALANLMIHEDAKKTDTDKIYIKNIVVDDGPTAKRWIPRAMGRATRIRKRTSHLSITLSVD
ncbi:MAG: 50S ribosomal protein L22 [candidate division Zixibacteria bacterium]|nr:50S ribosomal protein L22 [Candidatus Tariuqbacter arcticus]